MNNTTITAVQASLPDAIPAVQRVLPGELVYPLFTRLADWCAGRGDAPILKAMLAKAPALGVTPWMGGLRGGFLTAAARDRRDTTALQAPLRDKAAAAVARIRSLDGEQDALRAAVNEALNAPLDDQPRSAGEALETPEQRRHRRQRDATRAVAAAKAHLARNTEEREELIAELSRLAEMHRFHETAHNYRVEALRDYYTKRQSVYLRRGLKGVSHDGLPPVVPEVEIPLWPAEPLPPLTDAEHE